MRFLTPTYPPPNRTRAIISAYSSLFLVHPTTIPYVLETGHLDVVDVADAQVGVEAVPEGKRFLARVGDRQDLPQRSILQADREQGREGGVPRACLGTTLGVEPQHGLVRARFMREKRGKETKYR